MLPPYRKVWPLVLQGCRWVIGNGRVARFWLDPWVENKGPLIHNKSSSRGCRESLCCCLFIRMWLELECVSDVPFLPHHLCLLIAGIKPPHNFAPNDRIIWGGGRLIKGTSPLSVCYFFGAGLGRWEIVWKCPGPQRIPAFLWLVLHNNLLTNVSRK
jgi:hypothetical protein